MNTVDIIIPVYGGYGETVACLRSVLEAPTAAAREIIAIYDAGPDPRLLSHLQDLAAQGRITLLINPENLGFVKTVNRGLALHPDRDVVLLNSDTEVANDWLDRLLACARSDPRIATVTPFSNNAEICSFPALCQSSELPAGWSVAQVDAVFARQVAPAALDIPTAVGFCMFIARRALDDIGHFNAELFGRGYGEENDFCRRLAARGWRNVLCTDVFVYHCGGVSFGAEKAGRIAAAMQTLDRLYPDYHRLVHEFIAADSPRHYRQQAQLAMLRAERPRLLFVTHNLDGGTAKHVRELADYLGGQFYCFVARMRSADTLELAVPAEWGALQLEFQWPEQAALFFDTIAALGIDRVHIHHVKGIEPLVQALTARADLTYDVTLHDYYLINGNPALTDKTGQFCRDPATRDAVCAEHAAPPLDYSAEQWRRCSGELLRGAQRIFAPSRYAAAIHADYFPDLDVIVAAHPDWEIDAPYPSVRRAARQPDRPFRIVVLGALGLEKGADVLDRVALLAARQGLPIEFHLLGYAYRALGTAVSAHGAYEDSELDSRLAALAPDLIWFPCQWPETYSYTLSACLRGGYPVLAPALGAFIERLESRPLSWLQPFPVTPEQWLTRIAQLERDIFAETAACEFAWPEQALPAASAFRYADHYVTPAPAPRPPPAPAEWLDLLRQLGAARPGPAHSRRERLLRLLLRLRQTRSARLCLRLVPFSLQRRVKRWLSPRALHQIAPDLL